MSSSYQVVRQTWLSEPLGSGAVLVSVLTTFVMALLSFGLWWNVGHAQDWMTATGDQVFAQHEWWRAWTTLVAHADFGHLASNAFLFSILGIFLFQYFGFWIFPVAAFFFGGLFNLLVLATLPGQVILLGASGVVFWMGGFWLTLYCYLERTRSRPDRGLRAVGVALALFMPAEKFDPGISYMSHFLGFIVGVLCGMLYFRLNRARFRAAEVWETIIDDDPAQAEGDGQ